MSTQLKGHGLRLEGRPFTYKLVGSQIQLVMVDAAGTGSGVCSCGEVSTTLPSNAARRRWHNEHKDSLR